MMGLVPFLATCHISRIVVLFMYTVFLVANKVPLSILFLIS